jgi:hypothetical protein
LLDCWREATLAGSRWTCSSLAMPPRPTATVARLIQQGGQRPIDAGPLRRARQLEGLGLLTITLQSSMAKPWMTGAKIVA